MPKKPRKPTVLDDSSILGELEELAESIGLQIRHEHIKSDDDLPNVPGGICRLKGDRVVILNSKATTRDRIRALAEALRHFDLEGIYIRPAVRRLLDKAR